MAVEAVGYVVIQKLTDMLNEESIMGQKLIVDRLERIRGALEEMKGYFIDAEKKQKDDSNIKNWADEYLKNVYYVEDTIEIFAFRISRQRKRLGFLMDHALFLKNFTACKKLNRKMKKIQKQIKHLESERPVGVADASISARSNSTQPLNSDTEQGAIDDRGKGIAEGDEDREEERNQGGGGGGGDDVAADFDDENEGRKDLHDNMDKDIFGWLLKEDAMQKQDTQADTVRSPRQEFGNRFSRFRERLLLQSRLMSSSSYDADELEIVGFKEYLHKLAGELNKEGRGARRIISIFGKMGSGKTTLTQAVVAIKGIKDRFKSCCVRVSVSKESTTEEILLKLLKQVESSTDQGGVVTMESLKARLVAHLNDKRYLIVLDDVWTKDTWESLRGAFPENKKGSKIIITTCHEEVAEPADKKFCLKRLNDQESWELFVKRAEVYEEVPDNLKQVILERCDGLPLNIVLLGSLLSTKKKGDYDQLFRILRQQQNWSTLDILAFSYNDLPSNLQLCMLYMVIFPKDHDIPVRRLLRLWLAEGFIKPPDKKDFPEDLAQQYFDNLFQRSLIQISKQRSDGNHRKKCRLLGVLHDFLSSKASDINLFHTTGKPETSFGARRLVEYVDSKNSFLNLSKLERVRSYLSFNFQKKDIQAIEVENLLKKMIKKSFRLLRVLDLEGVYKPSLPDNLGDFFHLRYLGLRWTFLDFLPPSVGDLTHLETLDIKHTYVNSLPPSVWKLKRLRHLNLNETRFAKPVALPLPQLLTLWGLSIVENECLVSALDGLHHLRELGITFHLNNCECLLDWISKLTSLRQLRLRSKDDRGRPSELSLKSFSNLKYLSNLNLLGHLPKLPELGGFPENIKVLSLSVSQLKDDPMPTLGKLKQLTVLRLLANSYLGEKLVCPQEGFPELRVLKLWMLKNLEEWYLEEGAMEKLEELNIRCCCRLKSIPGAFLARRAFKELTVSNMPEPFIKDVEKNESRRFSVIVKNYPFTPLPWEQGEDSFDGMFPKATSANGC